MKIIFIHIGVVFDLQEGFAMLLQTVLPGPRGVTDLQLARLFPAASEPRRVGQFRCGSCGHAFELPLSAFSLAAAAGHEVHQVDLRVRGTCGSCLRSQPRTGRSREIVPLAGATLQSLRLLTGQLVVHDRAALERAKLLPEGAVAWPVCAALFHALAVALASSAGRRALDESLTQHLGDQARGLEPLPFVELARRFALRGDETSPRSLMALLWTVARRPEPYHRKLEVRIARSLEGRACGSPIDG